MRERQEMKDDLCLEYKDRINRQEAFIRIINRQQEEKVRFAGRLRTETNKKLDSIY